MTENKSSRVSLLLQQVSRSQNRFTTGSPPDETRGNTGPKQVLQVLQVFSPNQLRERDSHTHPHAGEKALAHGAPHKPVKPVKPVLDQQRRGFEHNRFENEPDEPVLPPASLPPAGELSTKPIAGDRIAEPGPHRTFAPLAGSLQARLVAVGATVNTYGKRASVRAPAGIPLELVREVEARGWAIIPGGRPNDEAEHDTWLAGVPIAELER